jgi:hypothetical protein
MTGMRWKFWGELVTALDVARHDFVGQPAFLKQDRNLLAIGRRPVMQIDHREFPFG